MRRLLVIVLGLLLSAAAIGRVEVHQFDNPAQEARYNKLIAELRCLVCQNQNLADSNAELAVDLRRKTYEMVKQGQSEKEIAGYMVDRTQPILPWESPHTGSARRGCGSTGWHWPIWAKWPSGCQSFLWAGS